jgi:hypothetical protein
LQNGRKEYAPSDYFVSKVGKSNKRVGFVVSGFLRYYFFFDNKGNEISFTS